MDQAAIKTDIARQAAETLSGGISFAGAGAILTVDLDAIRTNYRLLRQTLGSSRCAGVVKANAYGLGAIPVALALATEGCDTFFVAHLHEGVELRQFLGTEFTIYVLNGLPPGAERDCTDAHLTPVLNSLAQLRAWRDLALHLGKTLSAAVQVDSGMSRLGMAPEEVTALADDPHGFDNIDVRLVMSHLARADEPVRRANEQQRLAFEALAGRLPKAAWSLANSSGIFLDNAYRFDLARPGAALYGLNPTPGAPNPMLPTVRLEAKVIQTRRVSAGTGIGYGHVALAPRDMEIATIGLGYADGWPRRAVTTAHFKGTPLPFIGRVSMDSIILDVSALPPQSLAPGDLVELIGEHQTVDHLAAEAGTIGYEILTGLGNRFHRVYRDSRASIDPP